MRINDTPYLDKKNTGIVAVSYLLREAKKLHRAAGSDSRLKALPILRRLLSTQTFRKLSLPELYRQRDSVQRKHILHMLAVEGGYSTWSSYKQQIGEMAIEELKHPSQMLRNSGYPNLWFSSMKEAEEYSVKEGGIPIPVGTQAVIIPYTPES